MADPRTLQEQHEFERDYQLGRKDKDGNLKVGKIGNKNIETLRGEYEEYEANYDPNAHLSEKYRKLVAKSDRAHEEEQTALRESQPQSTVVTFNTVQEVILPLPDETKGAVKTLKEQTEANEAAIKVDKKATENPPKP